MQNIQIVPAVLEAKFAQIAQKVEIVKDAQIADLQIDICDGQFVPSQTFGSDGNADDFRQIAQIAEGLKLELDLMVIWDDSSFDKWVSAIKVSNCARVVIHFSSVSDTDKWQEIFNVLKNDENCAPMEIGLGVSLDDDNDEICAILDKCEFDFAQVMGIAQIGFGAQELDARTLEKIVQIAKQYPQLQISVDGGVKLHNAVKLIHAGATRLVAGSALFGGGDIAEAVKNFQLINNPNAIRNTGSG